MVWRGTEPISTVGHTLGKTKLDTKVVKKLLNTRKTCPIHRGLPMKITKKGFIRACKVFYRREVLSMERAGKGITCGKGFRNRATEPCLSCKVGQRVQEDKAPRPPKCITFIKVTDDIL